MADHLPLFTPGAAVTYTASAAVIGGRVVEVSGARTVANAAAGSTKTVGVAGFDAATGEQVTVFSGGVHPLTCSAAITAGDRVAAAAAGKVATTADGAGRIGLALSTTTAADQSVDVKLD